MARKPPRKPYRLRKSKISGMVAKGYKAFLKKHHLKPHKKGGWHLDPLRDGCGWDYI